MAIEPNAALAEFDRRNQELADWRSMEHRVLPGVRSMSDYRVNSTRGLFNATLGLRQEVKPPPNPTAAELLAAHKRAYGDCVKDAGAFRKPGEFATFGGLNGAESQRVPLELQRLHEEMAELLAAAKTEQQKAAIIAFFHARFIAIHPFMDGNGRLGRAVMATQVEKILGKSARPLMDAIAGDKQKYVAALNLAFRTNDLGALTKFVTDSLAIESPEATSIPSPFKITCRRMLSLGDIKPMEEERRMAATGADLPLAQEQPKSVAFDFGAVGVPFTVLAPLRTAPDGKSVAEDSVAKIRQQALPCQAYHIQIHTADGRVLDTPAHALARNLAEWQARDPNFQARLSTAITIGISAKDHEALVARCNRDGTQFPSAHADVSKDRALRVSDPGHRARYLSHDELKAACLSGEISKIDARASVHRLPELSHIGISMDKAKVEFSALCREVASLRKELGPRSPANAEPVIAPGSALLDRITTALESPSPALANLTAALEQHFSRAGTITPAARDNIIAGSFARLPNGERATAASVAGSLQESLAGWKQSPDNKRRSVADFVVDHLAANMTAPGVRGLVQQMDPADQRRYGKQLACEHPALDWARTLRPQPHADGLSAEQAALAAKNEVQATSQMLTAAFGSSEAALAAFATRPGAPAPRNIEEASARLVETRQVWLKQAGGLGDPGANGTFLAGYLEQNLRPEGLTAYKERMTPPMRLWHENRVAELAAHPARQIPQVPLRPAVHAEMETP